MAAFDGKFESAKQEWATPVGLFGDCDCIYQYNFDLAASPDNAKCPEFYTEEDNSLSKSWHGLGKCWLNPPYGDTKLKLVDWIKKSYYETQNDENLLVSMLIPARTNTKWFKEYCLKAYAIDFIIGRPIFIGAKYGLPQPLILVTFKKTNENMPLFGYIEV